MTRCDCRNQAEDHTMRSRRRWTAAATLIVALCWAGVSAQPPAPRPFPQPSQPRPGAPATPGTATAPPQSEAAPNEAMLGAPLYPAAQFLGSYDAGRGQRFYLFGVTVSFTDLVTYYRTTLRTRGDVLFETPPTHQFELDRFREETMAFPPSVTIKDYTWGGSPGYPNPQPNGQPARFPTIIQIVPVPRGAQR